MKGRVDIAHLVTCLYCSKKFDRDKEPFAQVSARRYAHLSCSLEKEQQKSKEEKDKEALEKYIKELLKNNYSGVKVKKQIKDYISEYNYTYSGILKALIYFYEIKGNSVEKAQGGIGIVPYIYNDAYNYYYNLWIANQQNEKKDIQSYIPEVREIKIPIPKRNIKKRNLFTFLDEEEVNNG